jgi:hypothetical protein
MESEVDALYGLQPGEFTAARDALVKRYRTEKRKEDAASVSALRRPTMAVWALNQVARGQTGDIQELRKLGRAALAAQARVMEGEPISPLHEIVEHRRVLIGRLVRECLEVLKSHQTNGDLLAPALRSAFETASVDEVFGDLVSLGRVGAFPSLEEAPPGQSRSLSPAVPLASGSRPTLALVPPLHDPGSNHDDDHGGSNYDNTDDVAVAILATERAEALAIIQRSLDVAADGHKTAVADQEATRLERDATQALVSAHIEKLATLKEHLDSLAAAYEAESLNAAELQVTLEELLSREAAAAHRVEDAKSLCVDLSEQLSRS